MNTLWILVVVLLAGFVTAYVKTKPVVLPNGTQGYAINCPGTARDISDCMNKAAEICGGKYQILDRDGNVAGSPAIPRGRGAVWGQSVHRTLIASCQPQ